MVSVKHGERLIALTETDHRKTITAPLVTFVLALSGFSEKATALHSFAPITVIDFEGESA